MADVKDYLARVCSTGPLADRWLQVQQLYDKRYQSGFPHFICGTKSGALNKKCIFSII